MLKSNAECEVILRSRFLSLVLRHKPEKVGLTLDAAGWVDVDDLLAACGRHGVVMTRVQLETIVCSNEKQRFALSDDRTRIRANQGHWVPVELGYAPATPPAVLYHGTPERAVPAIRAEGLRRMDRHHVHLSTDPAATLGVGARRGRPVLLTVDAAAMAAGGAVFYLTPNGVWLTDAVPAAYIAFPA